MVVAILFAVASAVLSAGLIASADQSLAGSTPTNTPLYIDPQLEAIAAAKFKGVRNDSPGCTHAPPVKSGNSVHFKTTCPSVTSESDVTFHGDTSYEAKVTLTLAGRPMTQMVEGKWLAAKCDSSAM